IFSRICVVLRRDQIRSHMKRALDATDCSRKRSAAMSKADAEFWEPLKDAAENQGTNRKRSFGRHTDQPRQPIFWHALLAEHVPGMNKDRCVQFFSGAPHRLKRRIIEIQSVDATGMRVRIDMRSDLRTAHSQLTNASFQLACGEVGILHWNGRKARESLWMITDDPGHVVVKSPRKIEGIGWFCPIAEHHRHSGEHLHGNAVALAFLDTPLRLPYVVGDLAKDAIANHHSRAAGLVMIQPDESAVAVFRVEVRPVARQNVGVEVDLHDVVASAVSADFMRSEQRTLQRFHRLRLFDFLAALLAGTARVIVPEIEHRLAEMLNDVRAIKMDVFHQCPTIFAIENDVFFFSGWPPPLDDHTDRVRRPLRRMRHIWRDKEGFAFSDNMVHDPVTFAGAHLNIPFQLVEVLLRID